MSGGFSIAGKPPFFMCQSANHPAAFPHKKVGSP